MFCIIKIQDLVGIVQFLKPLRHLPASWVDNIGMSGLIKIDLIKSAVDEGK
jgi:hypothetical protein